MSATGSTQHDVSIELSSPHKVNQPWLENKSIEIEEALIERLPGKLLGQAVAANFEINGFEIDLTIAEGDVAEQRSIISEVLAIAEEVASIKVGAGSNQATQIRSGFQSETTPDEEHEFVPA